MVEIRPGGQADARMLADLGARTFVDAYADLIPAAVLGSFVSEAFGVEIQGSELADRASRFFIAEEQSEPLGYALVQHRPVPGEFSAWNPLLLARLYVDADAQGRRVGTRLWHAVLGYARRNGHDVIWLTVWEHNRRAIEVYRRWGFRDIGAVPFDLAGEAQVDRLMVLEGSGRGRDAESFAARRSDIAPGADVDLTPGSPSPGQPVPPPGGTRPPAS